MGGYIFSWLRAGVFLRLRTVRPRQTMQTSPMRAWAAGRAWMASPAGAMTLGAMMSSFPVTSEITSGMRSATLAIRLMFYRILWDLYV